MVKELLDKVRVSFDYDETLSEPHIRMYAEELIERGVEVWIVTSRSDTPEHIQRFRVRPESWGKINSDIDEDAKELGIPSERVIFTDFSPKYKFLENKNFLWHLDNDNVETEEINEFLIPGMGINCWDEPDWKEKCEKILKEKGI
jgi:hypothetical protein